MEDGGKYYIFFFLFWAIQKSNMLIWDNEQQINTRFVFYFMSEQQAQNICYTLFR